MAEKGPARIAGVLLLGVFAINVYLGLFDTILKQQLTGSTTGIPLHWYLNWIIAAVTLIAAFLLLTNPLNSLWVSIAGIIWPIVYVGSLGFDVYTKLCAGGGYCWPSRTAAFQYLILNNANPNASGGPWLLWSYTIPTAIGLLFIAWVLSVWALVLIRKSENVRTVPRTTPPPSQQPSVGPGPSTPTRQIAASYL
ncbi:MAG: hypothetical protein ACYC7D_11715 [Nitrososphaerales archaeon]